MLLQSLAEYGKSELFVIKTQSNAIISLDTLTFKFENNERRAFGKIAIPLWEAYTIPEHVLETLENVISNMNIVLEQLVPGLTIGVKTLGTQMLENGENGARIQLVSLKNKKAIPLRSESEGIKKIISILQLLVFLIGNKNSQIVHDTNPQKVEVNFLLLRFLTFLRTFTDFNTFNEILKHIRCKFCNTVIFFSS